MSTESYIGVDIGGTKMHFAYVENGVVTKQFRCSTDALRGQEDIVGDLVKGIGSLIDRQVKGIGVGVPGLVDVAEGIVFNVQNIPAWKNVPLRSLLTNIFNIPVYVGNDANCFALGEKYFGNGKNCENLVCLTLGTGVGAGVIVNNRLYLGNYSMAGEFGGIRYLDSDFETYCSGKYFKSKFNAEASEFANKAARNDPMAVAAFDDFGQHVGRLVEVIIYSYGPDTIILGGSLSKSFKYFENGMRGALKSFPHQHVLASTKIIRSDNCLVPVLGAAALVLHNNTLQSIKTNCI